MATEGNNPQSFFIQGVLPVESKLDFSLLGIDSRVKLDHKQIVKRGLNDGGRYVEGTGGSFLAIRLGIAGLAVIVPPQGSSVFKQASNRRT